MSQNRWKVLILALACAASGLAFAREARRPIDKRTNCAKLQASRDLREGHSFYPQAVEKRMREIGCAFSTWKPKRQGGGR